MNLRRLIQYFPWLLSLRIRLIILGRVLTYPLRFLPGTSRWFGPPRRLHYSVYQAPGCTLTKLSAQYSVRRATPVTNSELVKATFARMPEPTVEEAYVAALRQGRYFGDRGGCVVAEDDGLVWTHSPTNYTFSQPLHQAFSRLRLARAQRCRQAINLTTRSAEANYWHWMMDCVPRYRLLQAAGIDTREAVWLIDHQNLPYQLETLQVLGIPESAVIVPHAGTHIEAETLFVPSYLNPVLTTETVSYARENLEFLRETFLRETETTPAVPGAEISERIYATRGNSARSFANEEEVSAVLESKGFVTVQCESLPVREQARIFSCARVVVGLHGAALTNVAFCPSGTTVAEIFVPDFIHPYFWTLCAQAGHRYAAYCEDTKRIGVAGFRYQRNEGTTLDIARFDEFLQSVLA